MYRKLTFVSIAFMILSGCGGGSSSSSSVDGSIDTKTPNDNQNMSTLNKPPEAVAGKDILKQVGKTVVLDAKNSSDDKKIVSYEWKYNDKILSTNPSFSRNNFTIGKHEILLTVWDEEGLSSSDKLTVLITKDDETVNQNGDNNSPNTAGGNSSNQNSKPSDPTHTDNITSGLKAFPTAQGYGAVSKGGRGGIIYKVTNLEWNDEKGSLKYGLYSLKEPRVIVFDVSGVIEIPEYETGYLTYENSYVTVAGQTSEGGITLSMRGEGSIALRSYNLDYNGGRPILFEKNRQFHDAIFQNIRFRGTNNSDNLSFAGVYNIIIDHCDFSGATDEALDITYAQDVTVQNTSITNTMGNYGFLLAYKPTTNISLHHNLTANLTDRCLAHIHWEVAGTPISGANLDIKNNIGYNCWHESFVPMIATKDDIINMNFVNNHFIVGPNSAGPKSPPQANMYGNIEHHTTTGMLGVWYEGGYSNQNVNIYANGNLFPDSDTENYPSGQRPLFPNPSPNINLTNQAFDFPAVATQSANETKTSVMARVGAWPRDDMNKRVINEINTKTGSLRNVGDALLRDNPAPLIDSDNDGMADSWEKQNGLDTGNNDSALDKNSDGYTNIEEYLHYKMQDIIEK